MSEALSFATRGSAEPLIASVVANITSKTTQAAYTAALTEFFAWVVKKGEHPSKPLLVTWRTELAARGLAVSSINQRLSAVRLLFRQAATRGALPAEEAALLASVENLRQQGQRSEKWLTEKEASRLLAVPDVKTTIGLRDRAILTLLVVCALRRDELVRLEVSHLQLRNKRWVLLDLLGKGRRCRTVAVPYWVKRILDAWLAASGITDGPIFRIVRRGGKIGPPRPLSDDAIYTLVRKCGSAIGHPDLAPHDLRRTCAKLCRNAGGELEQIQFLLGHASIQTTERYLGSQQDLIQAVNDRVRIRVTTAD